MSGNVFCKMNAALIIAMLAGAEVREIQGALSFRTRLQAGDSASNGSGAGVGSGKQDSLDKMANKSVNKAQGSLNKLLGRMKTNLFNRALKVSPIYLADLDQTALQKTAAERRKRPKFLIAMQSFIA